VSGGGPKGGDAWAGEDLAGFGAASRIAGYRLEQRIGAGGMAVVFRARDERLGRLVALKILAPGLSADGQFVPGDAGRGHTLPGQAVREEHRDESRRDLPGQHGLRHLRRKYRL